jgi:hypothetical protein
MGGVVLEDGAIRHVKQKVEDHFLDVELGCRGGSP